MSKIKGIVIDAGHGGTDPGASGNGIIEKELTLEISKYLQKRFKELGIPTELTRNADITLSPDDRVKEIKKKYGSGNDVILISNHINAGGGEGAEVIYALRNTDNLSSKVINELQNAGQKIRKFYQKRLPSNTNKDYYFILRDTANIEAIIVEYGFLDNLSDANRLKNNYKTYAEAVVKAVANYLNIPYTNNQLGNVYIVQKGDSLWSISQRFNTTVEKLKQLNNLTSNILSIGQTLVINNTSASVNPSKDEDIYIVQKGDSLWSISQRFNTTVEKLKQLNNLTSNILSIGQRLVIPSNNQYYIVQKGDTLWSIAKNNNITVNELKEINNLSSNILSINQKLKIK